MKPYRKKRTPKVGDRVCNAHGRAWATVTEVRKIKQHNLPTWVRVTLQEDGCERTRDESASRLHYPGEEQAFTGRAFVDPKSPEDTP